MFSKYALIAALAIAQVSGSRDAVTEIVTVTRTIKVCPWTTALASCTDYRTTSAHGDGDWNDWGSSRAPTARVSSVKDGQHTWSDWEEDHASTSSRSHSKSETASSTEHSTSSHSGAEGTSSTFSRTSASHSHSSEFSHSFISRSTSTSSSDSSTVSGSSQLSTSTGSSESHSLSGSTSSHSASAGSSLTSSSHSGAASTESTSSHIASSTITSASPLGSSVTSLVSSTTDASASTTSPSTPPDDTPPEDTPPEDIIPDIPPVAGPGDDNIYVELNPITPGNRKRATVYVGFSGTNAIAVPQNQAWPLKLSALSQIMEISGKVGFVGFDSRIRPGPLRRVSDDQTYAPSIFQGWTIDNTGALILGTVRFCTTANSTIYGYWDGIVPAGCTPVTPTRAPVTPVVPDSTNTVSGNFQIEVEGLGDTYYVGFCGSYQDEPRACSTPTVYFTWSMTSPGQVYTSNGMTGWLSAPSLSSGNLHVYSSLSTGPISNRWRVDPDGYLIMPADGTSLAASFSASPGGVVGYNFNNETSAVRLRIRAIASSTVSSTTTMPATTSAAPSSLSTTVSSPTTTQTTTTTTLREVKLAATSFTLTVTDIQTATMPGLPAPTATQRNEDCAVGASASSCGGIVTGAGRYQAPYKVFCNEYWMGSAPSDPIAQGGFLNAASFDDCLAVCDQIENCVALSYSSNSWCGSMNCRLYSSVSTRYTEGALNDYSNWDSAMVGMSVLQSQPSLVVITTTSAAPFSNSSSTTTTALTTPVFSSNFTTTSAAFTTTANTSSVESLPTSAMFSNTTSTTSMEETTSTLSSNSSTITTSAFSTPFANVSSTTTSAPASSVADNSTTTSASALTTPFANSSSTAFLSTTTSSLTSSANDSSTVGMTTSALFLNSSTTIAPTSTVATTTTTSTIATRPTDCAIETPQSFLLRAINGSSLTGNYAQAEPSGTATYPFTYIGFGDLAQSATFSFDGSNRLALSDGQLAGIPSSSTGAVSFLFANTFTYQSLGFLAPTCRLICPMPGDQYPELFCQSQGYSFFWIQDMFPYLSISNYFPPAITTFNLAVVPADAPELVAPPPASTATTTTSAAPQFSSLTTTTTTSSLESDPTSTLHVTTAQEPYAALPTTTTTTSSAPNLDDLLQPATTSRPADVDEELPAATTTTSSVSAAES